MDVGRSAACGGAKNPCRRGGPVVWSELASMRRARRAGVLSGPAPLGRPGFCGPILGGVLGGRAVGWSQGWTAQLAAAWEDGSSLYWPWVGPGGPGTVQIGVFRFCVTSWNRVFTSTY